MHIVIKMTDYNVLMNQDNMIIIWDTVGMSIQYVCQYVNEDLAGREFWLCHMIFTRLTYPNQMEFKSFIISCNSICLIMY